MQRFIVPMEKSTRVERGPARERHGGRQPAHLKKISFISEISYSKNWGNKTGFPETLRFNNTHLTQRIASGSGAPGANAVSRSRLSASVTGHFSLAAVVWNQVMTVVKGQSQGCLAWVWNSLPLR